MEYTTLQLIKSNNRNLVIYDDGAWFEFRNKKELNKYKKYLIENNWQLDRSIVNNKGLSGLQYKLDIGKINE